MGRRQEYYEYLRSDVWKRKRRAALREGGYKCWMCNARATQVHHLKYPEKLGEEPLGWLVSICRRCHEEEHNVADWSAPLPDHPLVERMKDEGPADWEGPPPDPQLIDWLLDCRLLQEADHGPPVDSDGDPDFDEDF